MSRTGALRRIGLGLVAVLGASLLLGGCNSQKKEMDALKAENNEWREKYATLEQANRDKDTRNAELEQRLAAANTKVQEPQTGMMTDGGGNVGGGKGAKTGGGGDGDFSKDNQGNMRARLSGDVLFAPGQATLKADSKKSLDRIANTIKTKYSGHNVRVEGYTDSDPIKKSKFPSNDALSEARAQAVEKYLASKGISAGRIEAVGYGSSKPKSTKAASRRVEIVILN
ncbi:MAG: OmpA family protein [Planctomycetes bacterium]|nr:OmpA family protein [Planctomycetota bacterium]